VDTTVAEIEGARVVATVASTLPADDSHPYRTGAWRPQVREWDAEPVVVQGEVPTDLDGTYLRNTENPVHPALSAYHPFDGDAMLHMIEFRDGRAAYRNRFVRTDGFLAEADEGQALWSGVLELPDDAPRTDGWGIRGRMKDASSTDVVVHRGEALTSFYFCGDLYRTDLSTGATLGKQDWNGAAPDWGISAHTKVDPATGELLFFSYSKEAPHLRYGSVDAEGHLQVLVDVPLPGARLPHDIAFTEHHVILNDFPLYWREDLVEAGLHVPKFHRDLPSRFAVLRRDGTGPIRWFEADPTFVLHFVNAYEDGDQIVMDGFFQGCPQPSAKGAASLEEAAFRSICLDGLQTVLHRWRFDLTTGATTEEHLSDRFTEFGMMPLGLQTRPHRYVYAATGEEGRFLFDGLVKHDVVTGREETITFGPGVYGSETVVVPRPLATDEDDAYLVTFTTDVARDESCCVVYAASDLAGGPLCTLRLPERISSGTHATWASREELAGATMLPV
jgi:carotenoid cleavage dioxygenase